MDRHTRRAINKAPVPEKPFDKRLLLILMSAVFVFYANSFLGAFVFDDGHAIVDNPHIKHLWPLSEVLFQPSAPDAPIRPLINLTFAVNFALGGLNPWGYHLVNLLIHLAASILLCGILRCVFLSDGFREKYRDSANALSFVIALFWAIHPLQTESVTYIVQRAESLTGLFYLAALYCTIRSVAAPKKRRWTAGAIISCVLGIATKEITILVPILVLCYDRFFLSGSFLKALKARWKLYLGLLLSVLIPLAFLLTKQARSESFTVGLSMEGNTPLTYALTQAHVLLKYLKLVFWPMPLIIDYGWFQETWSFKTAIYCLTVLGLVAASLWAYGRKNIFGFFGVWFFLILAPTSSFLPLADPYFEHRMYLPLAAVITVAVLAVFHLLRKSFQSFEKIKMLLIAVILCITVALGYGTYARNKVYRSPEILWNTTMKDRPENPRVYDNLAFIAVKNDDYETALKYFLKTYSLNPGFAGYANSVGIALTRLGRNEEAVFYYKKGLATDPESVILLFNLGLALVRLDQKEEAIEVFKKAVLLKPEEAEAHFNLGSLLAQNADYELALFHCRQALELRPDYAEVWNNLGFIEANRGNADAAIQAFSRAISLKPDYLSAKNNLAALLESRKNPPAGE